MCVRRYRCSVSNKLSLCKTLTVISRFSPQSKWSKCQVLINGNTYLRRRVAENSGNTKSNAMHSLAMERIVLCNCYDQVYTSIVNTSPKDQWLFVLPPIIWAFSSVMRQAQNCRVPQVGQRDWIRRVGLFTRSLNAQSIWKSYWAKGNWVISNWKCAKNVS